MAARSAKIPVLGAYLDLAVKNDKSQSVSIQVLDDCLVANRIPLGNRVRTGLSKRNGAKFRELSQNFPKLTDWAVHLQVTLPNRT